MKEITLELSGTPEENSVLITEMIKLLEEGHTLEDIKEAVKTIIGHQ